MKHHNTLKRFSQIRILITSSSASPKTIFVPQCYEFGALWFFIIIGYESRFVKRKCSVNSPNLCLRKTARSPWHRVGRQEEEVVCALEGFSTFSPIQRTGQCCYCLQPALIHAVKDNLSVILPTCAAVTVAFKVREGSSFAVAELTY